MAVQGKKLTKSIEDKIISEKLLNPEASLRDIWKDVGVSHQAVDNVLDKAPELFTSIDTGGRSDIAIDTLDSIIENWNKIIDRFIRMAEWQEDEMIPIKSYNDLTSISWIQERAWKQKQIIGWKPTERYDIRDYSNLSEREMEEARNSLL